MENNKMKKSTALAISKAFSWAEPSRENAKIIINWLMPKINVEAFHSSIRYYSSWKITNNPALIPYFDPVAGLFATFGSILLRDEAIVREYALKWWPLIEEFLADKYTVIEDMIQREPKLNQILRSDIGEDYVEYYAKRLYEFFNVWIHNFPAYHGNDNFHCGGLIQFKQISRKTNEWAFVCRRCTKIIELEAMESETYRGRKYGR
jgi:hypothetical protein